MKKKLLGYASVDSGQLLICDPCYIGSEWKNTQFSGEAIYKDKKGKIYQYLCPFTKPKRIKKAESFKNYQQKMKNGKTMNEMIAGKEVENIPIAEKENLVGEFSYGGICETTMKDKHQLNFKMGHAGAGIAFSSGYGDGSYPVYGHFNKEGRCMKVEILMD